MKVLAFLLLTTAGLNAQSGPSYDNGPTLIGLVSPTGANPYSAMSTTGSVGPSYDYSPPAIILGYNSTTHKYYACGDANPCVGGGGGGGGNTTSTSLTTNFVPHANGANSIVNGLLLDNGTQMQYQGTGGFVLYYNMFLGDNSLIQNGSGAQSNIGQTSSGLGWADTMATAFTNTSGFPSTRQVGQAHVDFAPTSGTASYAGLMVNPAVNATSTGTAYGLVVAPKLTAMTGGTTKLAGFGTSTGAQGAGYTEVAYIGTSGDIHPKVYAVASLPSASTIGAGGVLMVSDSSSTTVGTCTGGGSNYMTAISNGTTWVCH
jgi:hypothetical protein